jgi:DNA-binding NarL/FixJ family response regulator
LDDQLAVFNQQDVHWTMWTYKDIDTMGWVQLAPDAPYVSAIRRVLAGDTYLSARMANRLLHGLAGGEARADQWPVGKLSDRELEVFGLIGQGLTTSQVAGRLHLSTKTIETHRGEARTCILWEK